ncbi:leucine--tRNA ligase [Pectobacteriaceae bacterium CE90]|nr:leucine--tRNA ligase [Prodigiosinella sp. LS101]WJV54119.1 leucine--tRNA ligase [Prodigiosinella sp. LS101]WJV58482.1 leucine--tRNA ligase [Pectobacteriaceae bacterium C111]WJY14869.1 leucine--tRNA ligase [Pectobacteriaceae bacterium CE90]
MDTEYNFQNIENEAQIYWKNKKSFHCKEDPKKEKYYCLSMFPYPSGKLHVGHVRNYALGDVVARFQRMKGKNVLQPMGWDSFGMPAENAAIKHNIPPAIWTYDNIKVMRAQFQALGFAYDWGREFATSDQDYYRWEQWFFTHLYEKGLVYKKKALVNWDPVDRTVLANEQVIDGCGWRSGAKVERKEIAQWFLRITDYAEELLADLDNLDWPEQVKTMQRNWIGKSRGLELTFDVAGSHENYPHLKVFTTRPDTLMGVTCLAIAAAHPLAKIAAEADPNIAAFCEECHLGGTSEADIATMEKRGMPTNYLATHPLSGETLPIYIANFVLMEYGTGAVMCVPAHDSRDWEFAQQYQLPIKPVIADSDGNQPDVSESAYTQNGRLINSGEFDGLSFIEAFDAIAKRLETAGTGRVTINYRLRDWGIARQRYWGTPIPMKYGPGGETRALSDKELPVILPTDVRIDASGSPLKKMSSFYSLDDGWIRDTDTFDTFMESSWYYARFCCADNQEAMLDNRVNYWLPVDLYIGGIEHAVLHLLYARFFHKLLRDFGMVTCDEPFKRLLTQGMVLAETYYRDNTEGGKDWFNPVDVERKKRQDGSVETILTADGLPVKTGGIEKMSKSKNNGVDAQYLIDRYGADTVRLFMMFAAPPEQSLEWSDSGVEGAFRFIKRVWKMTTEHLGSNQGIALPDIILDKLTNAQRELYRKTHETIRKTTDDIERRLTFNTAIAAVMELVNATLRFNDHSEQGLAVSRNAIETSILLLSPIIPHVTHALWLKLGHTLPVVDETWPTIDERALARDSMSIVIQVNGKRRAQVELPITLDEGKVKHEALNEQNVKRYLADKAIRNIIVVKGKLVNIVTA